LLGFAFADIFALDRAMGITLLRVCALIGPMISAR
jgi:hypothetical protein